MAENKVIKIVRGDDTNWNGVNFLSIKLVTELLDLSTFRAIFTLGSVIKTFNDISSGVIPINFSSQETQDLPPFLNGVLRLIDNKGKIATIESYIPFMVVSGVHGDAIATEPYEITFNVEQGGINILEVSIEGGISVEVGTTTTLPPGSEATVTNSGTFNHLILDFGIPKGERGDIGTDVVNTVNGRHGHVILNAEDVRALPDTTTIADLTTKAQRDSLNSGITEELTAQITINENDILALQNAGYITGIDAEDVTNALGYTPYDSSNPDNFISGIDFVDVTNALNYIPYDSSNPEGYITSASLPIVNNASITIQRNGIPVDSFTLNQANGKIINLEVPETAADVGALSDTTTVEDITTEAQQKALNSGATITNIGQIKTNADDILAIHDLIPVQATSQNQLADKNFVNSSIATNTANFIGTFNSLADLEAYTGPLTNNDYAFVVALDSEGNTVYNRYKYTGSEWLFEYALNNSSFTADQWASINSGITSGDVSVIRTALQPNDDITKLNNNAGYISEVTSTDVTNALGYTPYNSTNPAGYISEVTSTDVTNALGYTPYDSSNPAGYISGITSTDVTTALGYTPYDSTNPNNYTTKTYVDSIVGDIETLLGEI